MPSLAALRAFEAAARCQSFSAAARELNVTHAAIAQHVRSLEAEYSEALLERQGRAMVPTDAGRQLADALRSGFSTIADGVAQLRERREQRPLNISVTPAFAANWLMPRIGEFWAAHPSVILNISPNMEIVDLKRDGVDLAIRFGDGHWPNVSVELLTDGDFWVVAHPDLIEGRDANCPGDVADLPWVLERHMMERRDIIERAGVDLDTCDVELLNTNAMALSAVAAGLGVSVQPRSLVQEEVRAGRIARICALSQKGLGYYIVTVPKREPKGLGVFLSWLRSKAD